MKILHETLYSRDKRNVMSVERSLSKPVQYDYLPTNLDVFGYADHFSAPDHYTVKTRSGLTGTAFVTNILHELFHLHQVEEKFPTTRTKVGVVPYEQKFIDSIGTISVSTVLDLNVNERLNQYGYDSAYFFDSRYRTALEIYRNSPLKYDNKYEKIQMILQLVLMRLCDTQQHSNEIFRLYSLKNPEIISKSEELSQILKDIGFSSPIDAVKCLSAMYDFLDMWEVQIVSFAGQMFDSLSAIDTFLSTYTPKQATSALLP